VEIAEGTTETVNKFLSILSRFSAGTSLLHCVQQEVFINLCCSSTSYFNGIAVCQTAICQNYNQFETHYTQQINKIITNGANT